MVTAGLAGNEFRNLIHQTSHSMQFTLNAAGLHQGYLSSDIERAQPTACHKLDARLGLNASYSAQVLIILLAFLLDSLDRHCKRRVMCREELQNCPLVALTQLAALS